jgi:hypothetical protein
MGGWWCELYFRGSEKSRWWGFVNMVMKLPVSQKAGNFWRPFGHVTWKPTCVYMTGNGLQSLHVNPRRIFSQTSHPRNHFEGIPGWNFPWWRHHPARSPIQMSLTPDNSDANGKGQRSWFYGTQSPHTITPLIRQHSQTENVKMLSERTNQSVYAVCTFPNILNTWW